MEKQSSEYLFIGVAFTDLNVVKGSPAGKDLIAPFRGALREQGIKMALRQKLRKSHLLQAATSFRTQS